MVQRKFREAASVRGRIVHRLTARPMHRARLPGRAAAGGLRPQGCARPAARRLRASSGGRAIDHRSPTARAGRRHGDGLRRRRQADRSARAENGAIPPIGCSTERAMHHFAYRDGVLHAEAVNLASLAQAVGTPFYCYSTATLERHYRVFAGAFADVPSLVCYAVKANSNQAVIATLARLGAGADVVSGGELKRAPAAGVPPDKIMFSGIGKTARELALAVDEGILCVNVESEPELELLSVDRRRQGPHRECLGARQSRRRCARPTPRSRPATPRTSSAFRSAARARSMPRPQSCRGCSVAGVDMHIGSQITELSPFDDAFALLSDFVRALRGDGHTDLACRSRRRPRHSLSRGQRSAARSRGLCRGGQARDARARLQADLRARPADRRQRRHPGDARALPQARRGQDLRHRRRRA